MSLGLLLRWFRNLFVRVWGIEAHVEQGNKEECV